MTTTQTASGYELQVATFCKLHSGEWGLRGDDLEAGHHVVVEKRNGDVAWAIVDRIIWTDGEACIATIDDRETFYCVYCGYHSTRRTWCPEGGRCYDGIRR